MYFLALVADISCFGTMFKRQRFDRWSCYGADPAFNVSMNGTRTFSFKLLLTSKDKCPKLDTKIAEVGNNRLLRIFKLRNNFADKIYTFACHAFSAPQFFTEAWLGKIKLDAANNWRLKVCFMNNDNTLFATNN